MNQSMTKRITRTGLLLAATLILQGQIGRAHV